MDNKEFRKGNYFQQKEGNNIVKIVDKATGNNMSYILASIPGNDQFDKIMKAVSGNNLMPIKISKSLLNIICSNQYNDTFIFNKIKVKINTSGDIAGLIYEERIHDDLKELASDIKYLHQLQNAYQDITGDSLVIDEIELCKM